MKVKEIRNKTSQEVAQLKTDLTKDLMDARFKKAMSQLKDKSLMRKLRRDIARINTIIRENQ
jgi:large subunit ribosomal protein L29